MHGSRTGLSASCSGEDCSVAVRITLIDDQDTHCFQTHIKWLTICVCTDVAADRPETQPFE
jgi:hypothetical protein